MIPTITNPMGIPLYGRRLQYLTSTGTQYIDTGVRPDFANGDSIEISYYGAEFTGSAPCIFGSRETNVRNGVYCLANTFIEAGSEDFVVHQFPPPALIGDHIMSVDDTHVTLVGETYSYMLRHVTCGLPLFLFALNNYGTGTAVPYSGMRLYDWKYWHNGTLAQHLIPVLDRSGVPCLYDTISRTLKYNAGTGTFNYA